MTEEETDNAEDRGRLALGRRLIANALQYSSSPIAATAALNQLRHDAHLLPRIQRQLRNLLEGFHRDSAVIYNIQGMTDHGCDILVRLETTLETTFIGLQIKSHIELTDDDVVNDLVLQYQRAIDHYSPMLVFYIVLAADLTTKTKRQNIIQRIQQEFAVKPKVRVVDPTYVATFLQLSYVAMDGLTTQTMRTGDPVMASARRDITRHPLQAAILLLLTVGTVEGTTSTTIDSLRENSWLQAIAEIIPIAQLEGTAYGMNHDQSYKSEASFREFIGLSPLDDDRPQVDDDDDEWYYYYNEREFFEGISPDLRRYFLSATTPHTSLAPARLMEILPDLLELAVDDVFTVPDRELDEMVLKIEDHSALLCLAAEGRERHQIDGRELLEYLVELLTSGII